MASVDLAVRAAPVLKVVLTAAMAKAAPTAAAITRLAIRLQGLLRRTPGEKSEKAEEKAPAEDEKAEADGADEKTA